MENESSLNEMSIFRGGKNEDQDTAGGNYSGIPYEWLWSMENSRDNDGVNQWLCNDYHVNCNGRCCFSSSSGGKCTVGNCGYVSSYCHISHCIGSFTETAAFTESTKYW